MSDERTSEPPEYPEPSDGALEPVAGSIELGGSTGLQPGQPGAGWWLASDGQWYPPESAAQVTSPSGGPTGAVSSTRKSSDDRKALLAQTVSSEIAQGARIESQSEYQAVLVRGKPINHILHLILTLVTCGIWGIVWIILASTGGEKRSVASVDDFGNVTVQRL